MYRLWVSQMVLAVKNPPANTGDMRDAGLISGWGRPLEEGMATHSSILAWNPMDRGAWWAAVCGVAELHTTEQLIIKRQWKHR